MKVAKRTDSKSSHHKGKNSVTMYGDRCELDLLWPSCNKYMNSESLCYTRETNMLIIPQFKKSNTGNTSIPERFFYRLHF